MSGFHVIVISILFPFVDRSVAALRGTVKERKRGREMSSSSSFYSARDDRQQQQYRQRSFSSGYHDSFDENDDEDSEIRIADAVGNITTSATATTSEQGGEYELPSTGSFSSPTGGSRMMSTLLVSGDDRGIYRHNDDQGEESGGGPQQRYYQQQQHQRPINYQHMSPTTPISHNRSFRLPEFGPFFPDQTSGPTNDNDNDRDYDNDDDESDFIRNERFPEQQQQHHIRDGPRSSRGYHSDDDDDVDISPVESSLSRLHASPLTLSVDSMGVPTRQSSQQSQRKRSPLPIRLPVYDTSGDGNSISDNNDDTISGGNISSIDKSNNNNNYDSNTKRGKSSQPMKTSVSFKEFTTSVDDNGHDGEDGISYWSKSPHSMAGKSSSTTAAADDDNTSNNMSSHNRRTMKIRNRGSLTYLTESQKFTDAIQYGIPSPSSMSQGTLGYSLEGGGGGGGTSQNDAPSKYGSNIYASNDNNSAYAVPFDHEEITSPTSKGSSLAPSGGILRNGGDGIQNNSDHSGNTALSGGVFTVQSANTTIHTGSVHSGIRRENTFRKTAAATAATSGRDGSGGGGAIGLADDDGASSVGSEVVLEPVVFCGFTCSMWLSRMVRNPLDLHRISLCVVKSAPCFWCWCCNKNDLQGGASSDRFILARLNTITFFFTMMQVVAASWLASVIFWVTGQGALEMFSPHLWNVNGAAFMVGLIGATMMLMYFCTLRIIKEVDLVGAIRYLWFILWIAPFEIFFNITLFDYHSVTSVWVDHWWTQDQLSWFRQRYCANGTADTLCMVPIDGGPDFVSEEAWCEEKYDSVNCTEIRDDAQADTTLFLILFYTALASWGVVLLFLLLLVKHSLERIISKPIVQKSRETNVPGWLALPTIATALTGSIFLFSQSSVLRALQQQKWIGILYITSSVLFLVAVLMGWLFSALPIRSNVDKRNKSRALILFIAVQAINALTLGTIFVSSLIWSTNLNLTDGERGDVACVINDSDCTQCDEAQSSEDKCPEWTDDEVTSILRTQLKQSATLAAIFILYALNVLNYGIVLRRHLSMYQIDYV